MVSRDHQIFNPFDCKGQETCMLFNSGPRTPDDNLYNRETRQIL